MKVIKINAIWCSACLIMNKVWNKVLQEKKLETVEYDLDMNEEEAKAYNPGNVLPVFIFEKNGVEIKRVIGEKTVEEMMETIEELEK